jgi:hypothetical protein
MTMTIALLLTHFVHAEGKTHLFLLRAIQLEEHEPHQPFSAHAGTGIFQR